MVAEFNRVNFNRKGVKFSALAGNPLPFMCKKVVWNDGVVPVESAIWKVRDNAASRNIHTDLTGTADFSSFVKPRLAIGPKGNHDPEPPDQREMNSIGRNPDNPFSITFVNASYLVHSQIKRSESFEAFRPAFAKEVTISGGQSIEVELPVSASKDFGVSFMAEPKVSATLIDEKGVVRDKNLADSPEARALFRTIFVENNIATGSWKFKLENKDSTEAKVVIAAWNDAIRK